VIVPDTVPDPVRVTKAVTIVGVPELVLECIPVISVRVINAVTERVVKPVSTVGVIMDVADFKPLGDTIPVIMVGVTVTELDDLPVIMVRVTEDDTERVHNPVIMVGVTAPECVKEVWGDPDPLTDTVFSAVITVGVARAVITVAVGDTDQVDAAVIMVGVIVVETVAAAVITVTVALPDIEELVVGVVAPVIMVGVALELADTDTTPDAELEFTALLEFNDLDAEVLTELEADAEPDTELDIISLSDAEVTPEDDF